MDNRTSPCPVRCRRGPLRCGLVWALAAVAAVAVVKGTRIGPVVAVVSEDRGWGVHTGDALALAPFLLAAAWTSGRTRS